MSGSVKQKQYRRALLERVREGIGFDAGGHPDKLGDGAMDRSLKAGYKVEEFERRSRDQRQPKG